jgi:tRNA (cytosine34-C5)-methyltransferase
MCASPGSKTTQVLERLGEGGVVVANDASPARCHNLIRRTASLGLRAAALVVTCHYAQAMPRAPGAAADGGFDRIICDVPCTGDGTTRKHPEVFARWEVALAMRQHPLQLQIALRGAALLRVGGLLCYSTCSLNPIENEAVVAELLRRCGGALELVDGAAEKGRALAGGCAPGMRAWRVFDFQLMAHDSFAALLSSAAVDAAQKRLFVPSMWPPSAPGVAAQLARCVRLVPHRSDSGGFFVALLRKVRPLPRHPAPEWPRADAPRGEPPPLPAADAPTAPPPPRQAAQYLPIPAAVGGRIGALALDRAIHKRLFARTAAASRIVYMTAAAERCCSAGSRLNVVHAGATVFKQRRRRRGREAGTTLHATAEGARLIQSCARGSHTADGGHAE